MGDSVDLRYGVTELMVRREVLINSSVQMQAEVVSLSI